MSDSTGGSLPQPGWYPNPSGEPGYRWWDGRAWTEHVRAPEPSMPTREQSVPEWTATPVSEPASNQAAAHQATSNQPASSERPAPRYGEFAETSTPQRPAEHANAAPEKPRYGEYGEAAASQHAGGPQGQLDGQQPYGQQQSYGQQQPYGQQNSALGYAGPGNPYAPAVYPKVAEGTKVYTPFIWVQTILPILSSLTILFVNFRPYVESLIKIARDSSSSTTIDPSTLALPTGLGWLYGGFVVVWAASVVLAYFDWKRLQAVGVVRPFHWAFAFIPVVIPAVYVIGRSVTVRRRSHAHALWPIWALIIAYIIGNIISGVFVLAVVAGASTSF